LLLTLVCLNRAFLHSHIAHLPLLHTLLQQLHSACLHVHCRESEAGEQMRQWQHQVAAAAPKLDNMQGLVCCKSW
jgi:hypothetical protein